MENEKKYTQVKIRVPEETYVAYKIALLQRNEDGRKTPTSDLNVHIANTIKEINKTISHE